MGLAYASGWSELNSEGKETWRDLLTANCFGTYIYENQFFKYEGQWENGMKHGHGRLLMKDGTFYEGTFEKGEIQGHGYKYFATSHCKYTGQFDRGELHGYGIMQYQDGTMFEGEWAHNRKQGYGVLKTGENTGYKGQFVGSMRHGEGSMVYTNGDRYDGNWVMDKRQGFGHLICRDGTEYEGQWLNDMFNGEGRMQHASGIIYEGQWINGFPVEMTTKLVITVDMESLELKQTDTFPIRVECRNDFDEIIKDEGRELQVSAGFKYYPTKEGSALFDMIEDIEEKPVETPFGYSVVSYPLIDKFESEEDVISVDTKPASEQNVAAKVEETVAVEKETKAEKMEEKIETDETKEELKDGEKEEVKESSKEEEKEEEIKEEVKEGECSSSPAQAPGEQTNESLTEMPLPVETTPLPPPVANQRSVSGVCEWTCLQLAPSPPMYRPFLAMEEELSLKKSKSKKLGAAKEKEKSPDKTVESKQSKKDVKEKASTESVVDEQFARPGEYVIMVQDVTNPTFFREPIPPAFLLVKIQKPKIKKKESKPNSPQKEKNSERWDTQKHIAEAMRRSTS